jgi:N-acetylglutamate synthase-like GNAT family acetyltransferase
MAIALRRATAADDQMISDIICEGYRFIAGPDGITDEQLAGLLRAHSVARAAEIRALWECLLAEEDGDVAGLIAFSEDEIQNLFVRPDFHRRGVGTRLFRAAEAAIRESGQARMCVCTSGYGRPFYEAMGMTFVGKRPITMGPMEGGQVSVLEKMLDRPAS